MYWVARTKTKCAYQLQICVHYMFLVNYRNMFINKSMSSINTYITFLTTWYPYVQYTCLNQNIPETRSFRNYATMAREMFVYMMGVMRAHQFTGTSSLYIIWLVNISMYDYPYSGLIWWWWWWWWWWRRWWWWCHLVWYIVDPPMLTSKIIHGLVVYWAEFDHTGSTGIAEPGALQRFRFLCRFLNRLLAGG